MKGIKLTSLLLCTVILLSLFSGCGGSKFKDDVPVSEVGSAVGSVIGSEDDMIAAPESYISSAMKMDVSAYPGYIVKINSRGVNIDEYGIFKAADAQQAAEIETAVKAYFQFRIDSWMSEYMPEEFPKLENAEVKVFGSYVMYAILSDSDKDSAFSAFKKALTE